MSIKTRYSFVSTLAILISTLWCLSYWQFYYIIFFLAVFIIFLRCPSLYYSVCELCAVEQRWQVSSVRWWWPFGYGVGSQRSSGSHWQAQGGDLAVLVYSKRTCWWDNIIFCIIMYLGVDLQVFNTIPSKINIMHDSINK